MNFRPETNSLAVHVYRLRAKLASAGLAGIVNTTPNGSYALNLPTVAPAPPEPPSAIPLAERPRIVNPRNQ